LLRLQEDDGSLILPGVFMLSAERFNLAPRIDVSVLRRTIETLASRADRAEFALISVDLSGRSVGDRMFHRHVLDLLRAAGPDICSRLMLEVTKTAAVTSIADATVFVEQIHELGVKVALDDFGAGATSFGYLRSLKADFLKIDGQFIQGLLSDEVSQVTVRCFVEIAKVLGIATVAEFVDQPALLEQVRAQGIDFAQGFLLGMPEPFVGGTA
jgi:EAL domain-containing protein (putative c-di-GMP-specific phosphodiesterase class I)